MSQVPMRQEQKTKLQALRDTFNSSIAEGDHCSDDELEAFSDKIPAFAREALRRDSRNY